MDMERFSKAIAAFAGINGEKDWSEMVLTLANNEKVTYDPAKKHFVGYPDGEDKKEVAPEQIIDVIWKRAIHPEARTVNEPAKSTGEMDVHPNVEPNPFATDTIE